MTKRALFLAGGWAGHVPHEAAALAAGWLRDSGYETDISTTLDPLADDVYLQTIDLIVPVWSMGQISGDQLAGLKRAIKSGVGFGGWHGGMGDSFRNANDYQYMVGGQFVGHPGGIIDYTVQITDHDHPITTGLSDFVMRSEQYYMHVDPSNNVLATTTFSAQHDEWIGGTVMPVVWTRQYGAARVFFCSLGHVPADFDVPEAREIVQRGLIWATR